MLKQHPNTTAKMAQLLQKWILRIGNPTNATKSVSKWLENNRVKVLSCPSQSSILSTIDLVGRAEKVCKSQLAHNPDSVTAVLSGGMG